MIGIYKIENTVNGKCYVGSSINIKFRWKKHKATLRHNKHINPKLQAGWNKHGESVFEFTVLEECSKSELILREQAWMDVLGCTANGYNIRLIAESNRGYKHTVESRRKIGEASSARARSDSEKALHSERMLGTRHTEETKRKLSDALTKAAAKRGSDWPGTKNLDRTGKKQTPEQIAKRVAAVAATKARKKQELLDEQKPAQA